MRRAAVQSARWTNSANTLAVAQYRAGRFAQAEQTLARCRALRDEPSSTDLVFLAMTHYRLGRMKEAHEELAQVRTMARTPRLAGNAELRGFLPEAEALLSPSGAG